ncbi:MAG: hypothetical protein U0K68_06200 [Agathobacter sp.]|nr:hypothetical protein [Agathobacter sp.]
MKAILLENGVPYDYGKGVRTTVQTIQRVHNIYESMNTAFLQTQEKNNE